MTLVRLHYRTANQSTPPHSLQGHSGSVPAAKDLGRGFILTVEAVPQFVAAKAASFVLWLSAADSDFCTPKSAS